MGFVCIAHSGGICIAFDIVVSSRHSMGGVSFRYLSTSKKSDCRSLPCLTNIINLLIIDPFPVAISVMYYTGPT